MQNFAINGGALNGDPQVWIDDTALAVAIQAAGVGMNGLSLIGSASVSLASSGSLAYMAALSGQAGITITADGVLTNGLSLVGAAPVVLGVEGSGTRWAMIEGVTPTTVDASGDIAVVPAISATFTLVMGAELDLVVATGHQIEGYLPVVLSSTFQAYSVPATLLSGDAQVQMAGIGYGNLIIDSPPGDALIAVDSYLDTRIGEKISLEGDAVIEIYARGYLESLHYVYAEGDASIHIAVKAETHGVPVIPSEYFPAPTGRYFYVMGENRYFIVPKDRQVLDPSGYIPLVEAANALFIYANYELPSDMVVN